MRPLLALVTTVALAGVGASASAAGVDRAALDAALAHARARTGAPAAMATVMRDGRVVWSGASGVRDLRTRRPATTTTPVVLASTTKTVTATLVLQLVAAGRLSLDDDLGRFYPRLPNAAHITVRMLLGHTSGLAEYSDSDAFHRKLENPRHAWTRAEVIAAIGAPAFAPGARFAYTNSNYIVLGGILEQITGRPVDRLFTETIAGPLHLRDSTFTPGGLPVARFAQPYTRGFGPIRRDRWIDGFGPSSDDWGPVWNDGGLASTATDLARIGDGLFSGTLITAPTLAAMTTVGPGSYALGIYPQRYDGHRWLGHDGSYGGYESELWHDASRRLTIAVTTNLEEAETASDTTSDRLWRAIVRAVDFDAGARISGG